MSQPDPAPPAAADLEAILAELLRLSDAASPAPWRWGPGKSEVLLEEGILDANGDAVFVNCGRGSGEPTDEDSAFMVAARNLLPRVVKALQQAREEIDRLKAERWTCESCGCEFPPIPKLPGVTDAEHAAMHADVRRCSKCVEVEALRHNWMKADAEVCGILGKALNYPTLGPEVGGDNTEVCTADHVPATLAQEAAEELARLREEAGRLREACAIFEKNSEDAAALDWALNWACRVVSSYKPPAPENEPAAIKETLLRQARECVVNGPGPSAAAPGEGGADFRREPCAVCGNFVTERVDPEGGPGRICLECDSRRPGQ